MTFLARIKAALLRAAAWFSPARLFARFRRRNDTRTPLPHIPLPMADMGYDTKQDQLHACRAYTKLKMIYRDYGRINAVIEALGRDFLTALPEGAYRARLGQMAFLSRRMHEDLTSAEVSQLLGEAQAHEYAHPEDWDEWDQANLREMETLYRQHCHVDAALMERKAWLSYEGRRRHRDVLRAGDWEQAKGFLQEQIDLHRRIADARCEATGENSHYQMLMQEYMPGMRVADLEKWFGGFEKQIRKMVPEIRDRQAREPAPVPLSGHYPAEAQMWLNRALLKVIGFDFNRGSLHETGHNPVEGGTPEDTRLVIKIANTGNFLDSMKSALHEGGHGLYIQGLPRKEWRYQPVGMDQGAAVHESQALLIEMVIGRMPEFFEFVSPRLEGVFQGIGSPELQALNLFQLKTRVQPVLDRKKADEVTYFQHVLLRFNLERNLIEGKLEVSDLPEAWNEGAGRLVGLRPDTHAEGCLQDVHWFVGKFGYFPAYAIGHMMAAQQYEAIRGLYPDIDQSIRRGDFSPVKEWLNDRIHSKGRLLPWDKLLKEATGKSLNPDILAGHLRERYLGDHGLALPD